jgi:hypothetical protein
VDQGAPAALDQGGVIQLRRITPYYAAIFSQTLRSRFVSTSPVNTERSMLTHVPPKRLITTRAVADRYGPVHPRTVKRWWMQGVIPPPTQTINNRHYWDEAALDRHDRKRVANRARVKTREANS